ncbi:hypothetical protein [Albibacterium bauzanense]|uniref:TerB family tellurite resistance protein n=1 Tax=Albibacterium bauzanense TaxID=653929 RepID=A0A4R1LUG1_9SPHI|nr:hypothetical protein [Albibacterium bauzanense]TCK80899.1 hypothetical protein C8N28_2654 [Albibacterium bauzanense]
MKATLCIIFLFFSLGSQAQTWDEIFKQKKTQKKYLLQQILAMKIYAGYLKDGYDIASQGINSIKAFSNGEFTLHGDFFNSLEMVSSVIRENKKIADIVGWQVSIKKEFNLVAKVGSYAHHKSYVENVKAEVFKQCEFDLDELLLLVSKGELEMSDDERLKRLEKIHQRMQDKFQFTRSFISQIKILDQQIEQEKRNLEKSFDLYQIPN